MTRRRFVAAALAATLATPLASPALAHDGEALYRRHCVQCHSVARIGETLRAFGTPDEARRRLETLLPRHHATDADERDAIIAYLLQLRGGR